jgi:GR25 family glycosyltransferase involved in LPS biosynthesis
MNSTTPIIYINLEHRKDRYESIQNTINNLCKILNLKQTHRINAVYKPNEGFIGCSMSHINALQAGFSFLDSKYIIILEDDFVLHDDVQSIDILKTINNIIDLSQPDVIMLAGNPQKIKLNQFNLTQCEYVLSSSAYLVRREYIPKLISNIKESIKLRKPLDVHWNALQEKDTWILYRIGYQYANYSDIECKTVNYGV